MPPSNCIRNGNGLLDAKGKVLVGNSSPKRRNGRFARDPGVSKWMSVLHFREADPTSR
jgi:hypothetical protein